MKTQEIHSALDKLFPEPKCELNYKNHFQLLVAVILSAQCTDKRVNLVTEELFKEYGLPEQMAKLSQEQLEEKIHSCGFYHNKAKNILSMTRDLLEKFDGQVPCDRERLESLAGVGRKTANVVIAEAFKGQAIAVDTHVLRVSNRLGFAKTDNPFQCEKALMKKFEKETWGRLHLQLVHFGRYVCKAQNPNCKECPFISICTKHNI